MIQGSSDTAEVRPGSPDNLRSAGLPGGNNGGANAIAKRIKLMDYFNNAGAVSWQEESSKI